MKKVVFTILPVLACFLTGFIAKHFQAEAISIWYPLLNKSSLTPPNIVFPIVWSILYICMGLSIGLIIVSDDDRKESLTELFIVQLFLNFGWSIWFFYLENPLLGLIDIVLLDIIIIYYAAITYREHKTSSLLFIPYILWVLFATYLNLYIFLNN